MPYESIVVPIEDLDALLSSAPTSSSAASKGQSQLAQMFFGTVMADILAGADLPVSRAH